LHIPTLRVVWTLIFQGFDSGIETQPLERLMSSAVITNPIGYWLA
jgi:hypothetical protein